MGLAMVCPSEPRFPLSPVPPRVLDYASGGAASRPPRDGVIYHLVCLPEEASREAGKEA
jgi:hypothetical protein